MSQSTKVITVHEARAQGLSKFYTGKPCKHSHITERYVSTGACVKCVTANRTLTQAEKEKQILLNKFLNA